MDQIGPKRPKKDQKDPKPDSYFKYDSKLKSIKNLLVGAPSSGKFLVIELMSLT